MEIYVTDIDELCDFTFYWRIENFKNIPPPDLSLKSEGLKVNSSEVLFVQIFVREKYLIANIFRKKPYNQYSMMSFVSLLTNSKWVRAMNDIDRSVYNSEWSVFKTFKLASLQQLEDGQCTYKDSLTLQFRIICKSLECDSSQCLLVSKMIGKKTYCQGHLEYLPHLKFSDLLFDSILNKGNCKEEDEQSSKDEKNADTKVDFKDRSELLKFFQENELNFVTLKTPNKDFSVHKAVLRAKSPVFNEMFKNRQNETNSVNIEDMDGQTMAELVNFLHFHPMNILTWDSAKALYNAANKYEIDQLKQKSGFFLKERLSHENVCDALLLADLHQDKDLMSCAEEYFCNNSKFIFPTKSWKDMLSHTDLVAGILCKLGEKM